MILPSRLLAIAERGQLSLLIRSARGESRPRLRVGHSYPLQERKQEGLDRQHFPKRRRRLDPETGLSVESDEPRQTIETRCWVRVVDVVGKHAHEATEQEAKAAGFPGGRRELWRWWKETYDEWPADLERPGRVFEAPAWFYVVELLDEERYLAAGTSVPADPAGYTRSPGGGMRGEPAAVPAAVQDAISAGHMRSPAERAFQATTERERERQRKEMRSRIGKLRDVQSRAAAGDVDLASYLEVVDEQIVAMQRALAKGRT